MDKKRTEGGLQISTKKRGLLGWVTTAPNGKFSYVVARKQTKGGKQPLYDTEQQALDALMADA